MDTPPIPNQTQELEAAARRASAELALATAEAERSAHALADIRALCARHEHIPGSEASAIIAEIDKHAALAQGAL